MRKIVILFLFTIALLPFGAFAKDTLTIQSKIPFAKGVHVPLAVKSECKLPGRSAKFVQTYAKKSMNTVMTDDVSSKTKGKVLMMKITGVVGTGGGAWSGRKSVTTEGTLYDNGKKIGSFVASRHSGGGAYGAYKGTCSILGRCIKVIGKDVGAWLKTPMMNSRLGDSR